MNTSVNLLPYRDGRRLLIRRRLRQWLPVWLVVLVTSASVCGWQFVRLATIQKELADLQKQEIPSRNSMEAVSQIRLKLDQFRQRESLLKTLNSTGRPLQLIGIIGAAAAQADGALWISKFDLETVRDRAVAAKTPSSATGSRITEHMELTLQGTATDDLTVAAFVASMRESAVFETVVLESSVQISSADRNRTFNLVCQFH